MTIKGVKFMTKELNNNDFKTNKSKREYLMIDYVRKLTDLTLLKNPHLDREEVASYFKEAVAVLPREKGNLSTRDASQLPIVNFDKSFIDNDLVLTGSGSMYYKQKDTNNIVVELIDHFMTQRKIYKSKMFEHMNTDPIKYTMYDLFQQTMKILNNSFYGVLTQKNSIFYNPYSGPAVTYTGEDIVTTSVSAFESFLSSNVAFKDMNDALTYVRNIMVEKYNDVDLTFNKTITDDMLYDRLTGFFKVDVDYIPSKADIDILKTIISNMNQYDRQRVYYKNNIVEFFEDTDFTDKYMKDLFGYRNYISPNDPPEEIKEGLAQMWSILKDYILYNYLDFYRMQKADALPRKSVLTIDTDSNFVYLDPLYQYFVKKYPDVIDPEDKASRISTISVLNYNLEALLETVYSKLSDHLGIQDDYYKSYNMKNELLIDRLMLTPAKKQYALTVIQKEGNMYDIPKMDIKGLSIRKVNTNLTVRERYSDILENKVLFPKKIDLSGIISEYKNLETEIKESLESGSADFALPGKANLAENYKNPFSILPFKATMIWNLMYPEHEINLPNKIKYVKVDINNYEHVVETLNNDELISRFNKVFENENLLTATGGINAIAVPEGMDTIPETILPFVSIEEMVDLNTRAGTPILESLGFIPLSTTKYQLSTNIIKF